MMRPQIIRINGVQNVAKTMTYHIGKRKLKKIIMLLVSNYTSIVDYGRITFIDLGETNFPDFLTHATMDGELGVNINQIFMQTHSTIEIPINYNFKSGEKIKMELYYSSGERAGYFSMIFV
jgi:hypothetical protein